VTCLSLTPKKNVLQVCVCVKDRTRERKSRVRTRERKCETERDGARENKRDNVCRSTYYHLSCPCPSHTLHWRHAHNIYLYRIMNRAAGNFFWRIATMSQCVGEGVCVDLRLNCDLESTPPGVAPRPSPLHRDNLSCSGESKRTVGQPMYN